VIIANRTRAESGKLKKAAQARDLGGLKGHSWNHYDGLVGAADLAALRCTGAISARIAGTAAFIADANLADARVTTA
jgi:hypothetical protein